MSQIDLTAALTDCGEARRLALPFGLLSTTFPFHVEDL